MQRFRKLTKVEKHKAKNMYHIIHLLVGIFICVRNNTLTLRKNNMNNCHHEDPEKYFSNKIFRNYCLVFSEFSSVVILLAPSLPFFPFSFKNWSLTYSPTNHFFFDSFSNTQQENNPTHPPPPHFRTPFLLHY